MLVFSRVRFTEVFVMGINLPSLNRIIDGAKAAVKRFPFAMLTALAGTAISIALIHIDDSSFWPNVLITLILAFPVFTAIVLISEQRLWGVRKYLIANGAAVIFFVIYYILLPENIFEAEAMFIFRCIMWGIGFGLAITFVPFLKKFERANSIAFWQYNRILFYSLALTAVYAALIHGGLSIAMASTDYLFNVDIDGDRYFELWIVILGIFSTSFFLHRVPRDMKILEAEVEYPRELRLLSQYVLMPLVIIYFLILYAYTIKILVVQEWPKGVLTYMILGFSLLGVFTYISLHPLREKTAWVKKAGNIFYIVLIPQVGMLFWALWFRVSEYGITENRYLVFVFGVWLIAMAVYFLAGRKKDIKLIPITIFIIVLFSSFGPWGAFAVSERSQINRLEGLLLKNNLLVDNKIQKTDGGVAFEDRKEISAVIRYLSEVHGLDGIQPLFSEDFSSLSTLSEPCDDEDKKHIVPLDPTPETIVEELIGIDYVNQWEGRNVNSKNFNFYADYSAMRKMIDISNYNYMEEINSPYYGRGSDEDGLYSFQIKDNQFIAFKEKAKIAEFSLQEFIDKLIENHPGDSFGNLNMEEMMVEFENDNISIAVYFNNISGRKNNDGIAIINSANAKILFR